MRKLKLLLAALALFVGGSNSAWAQASFNHTYTVGVAPSAGGNYFLYNIGTGQFLTNGLNYGTRATVDNSGRVLTLAAATNGYSIYTDYVSFNNRQTRKPGYLTTNGYVDTGENDADWVFTPVTVAGYTNAYTINSGDDKYLIFDKDNTDPGCLVTVGNNTNNNYSYWLLIPKTTRENAGDYSHYLINTQMNACWEYKTWGGSEVWNDAAVVSIGGRVSNRCGEKYHAISDITQTITETVPNGRYRLFAQGFWRQEGSDAGPVIYANSDTKTLLTIAGSENDMNAASDQFTAGNYVNSVETFVNNGSLKVGINITSQSQWVIFDNFVLDYLGQCVMDYAVELPDGGAMTANTWYYFDIVAAADNYTATANTLSNIICVTDGYTQTSATTGTVTLTSKNNNLTAQRYYVKSSSNNNLVIDVASFSYSVGAATPSIADGAYIASFSAITFNFADATTNDPNATFALLNSNAKASLKKAGSELAQGTLTLDGKNLTATFSGVSVDLSSTYTIEIAAGVVGYENHESNTAISTTFKTGIIANGDYYFKKKGEYKYLTRGGYYGTETVVDNFGLSFEAILQADGTYYFKNIDHSLSANMPKYLNTYTDGGAFKWNLENSTNGYYLKYGEGDNLDKYLGTAEEGTYHYNYQNAKATAAEGIEWVLLSKEQYEADLAAALNAQATAIATAAGKTATTVAELESLLSSDFVATDMTLSIQGAALKTSDDMGKWTQVRYNGNTHKDADCNGVCAEIWNSAGGVKQEIASLPAGIYKVTVFATWRPGNQAAGNRVGDKANTTAWMYANTASETNITQLKQWYGADNSVNSRQNFVDAGDKFLNTTYVYVGNDETLTIGLASPSFCVEPWFPFYGFKLTRYALPSVTITAAGQATFCSDKDLDFTNVEGIKAYSAKVSGTTATFTEETIVPAGEGVLLVGAAGTYTIPVATSVTAWADDYNDFIRGEDAAVPTDAGNSLKNYILSTDKNDENVGFYWANGVTVPKDKAYLRSTAVSGNARLTMVFKDEATGIKTVGTKTKSNALYNLNGARVAKPAKGLYIQDGKIVVIK